MLEKAIFPVPTAIDALYIVICSRFFVISHIGITLILSAAETHVGHPSGIAFAGEFRIEDTGSDGFAAIQITFMDTRADVSDVIAVTGLGILFRQIFGLLDFHKVHGDIRAGNFAYFKLLVSMNIPAQQAHLLVEAHARPVFL